MDKRVEEIEKDAKEILDTAKRAETGMNAIQQGQKISFAAIFWTGYLPPTSQLSSPTLLPVEK